MVHLENKAPPTMKKILLFIAAIIFISGCEKFEENEFFSYTGDVIITDDSDIDLFRDILEGRYNVINGNVEISLPYTRDLSFLNDIRKIDGDLYIDSVKKVNFFIDLDSVGGNITLIGINEISSFDILGYCNSITFIESEFTELEGFDRLLNVDAISIINQVEPISIFEAFQNLKYIDNLRIDSLDVVRFDGFLDLREVTGQLVIDKPGDNAFPELKRVRNFLRINRNIGEDCFPQLEQVNQVEISNTRYLDLSNLYFLPYTVLSLNNCDGLVDLVGINQIEDLGELYINDCDKLQTLEGMSNTWNLSRVGLRNNPSLTDVCAILALDNPIWNFNISNCGIQYNENQILDGFCSNDI